MNELKKGDVVAIWDYSYSKNVVGGKLGCVNERNEKYVVVEVGCKFPLTDNYQAANYRNDTIIQNVESGRLIFIHYRFLKSATHKIIIDNKIVELSQESFENLKRQLLGGQNEHQRRRSQ